MRGRLARVADWLASRTLVGSDHLGNRYYLEYAGENVYKRIVHYVDGPAGADPNTLPIQWWSWLHSSRDDPPTEQEMRQAARDAAEFQRKVREVDEIDRKLRVRQMVVGGGLEQSEDQGVDVAGMQETLRIAMSRNADGRVDQHQQSDSDAPPQPTNAEAEGTGETFVPGAWQPNQSSRRKK